MQRESFARYAVFTIGGPAGLESKRVYCYIHPRRASDPRSLDRQSRRSFLIYLEPLVRDIQNLHKELSLEPGDKPIAVEALANTSRSTGPQSDKVLYIRVPSLVVPGRINSKMIQYYLRQSTSTQVKVTKYLAMPLSLSFDARNIPFDRQGYGHDE